MPAFRVQRADHAAHHAAIHGVRQQVFVVEQGVPADLERDALDPVCTHVLARDADGAPIGTGRLLPDGRIGRMAVLAAWRSQGVGEAMLEELVRAAAMAGLPQVHLHAQLPACAFYARQGFIPEGGHFEEAGIAHQQMQRTLGAAAPIEGVQAAVAVTTAVIRRARRRLWVHSRQLDPGLLDAAPVQAALRRFATRAHDKQLRVIVHDAAAIQAAGAPLLALLQRLPSVVQIREVSDPVDRALASACIANDAGDYYFRLMGHRLEGEAGIALPSRSQPLEQQLQRVWDRSRDCSELRALGI
ncbi:putative GNAT family N-acyltransferase [Stenotrophomonas maltophilia]|uniref:GNAT family N-acetyltransferase n=1 Tax=Stenotrophomonas chelatiphaga TaxID=517011 RepID=UPI000F4C0C97|nr:GNAT family N-acetyltransferase [Stenotrophomonas chelatiphaga]MCS4232020.1 putative GNAT family N-acyltransferase [Stenotrophomonas chelatiphaga]ROQ42583.1 putative GNAT family N-acyltransferase [Stenotrophomonas maltophilia]